SSLRVENLDRIVIYCHHLRSAAREEYRALKCEMAPFRFRRGSAYLSFHANMRPLTSTLMTSGSSVAQCTAPNSVFAAAGQPCISATTKSLTQSDVHWLADRPDG